MKTTMNVHAKTNRLMAGWLLAGALLTACSEKENPQIPQAPPSEPPVVSVRLADYHQSGASLDGENALTDLGACLFEDGVLTRVYEAPDPADGSWDLALDRYAGVLYLVANVSGQIDLSEALEQGMTEAEWLKRTVSVAGERPQHFFSGRVNLEDAAATPGQLSAALTRGVARFDLRIRTAGIAEVRSITLTNTAQAAYLFPGSGSLSPAAVSLKDASVRFDMPLTADTPAIAYLYEQTGADLGVSVEAVIDGVRHTLEGVLPRDIGRNRIYSLTLRKGIVDTEARLTVEAWGDGGESALQPDLETRLTVDAERSELPSGVRIEVGGTGLVLPHAEREVLLAVRSDVQLELEPVSAPLLEIAAEPATAGDFGSVNRFRIRKGFYTPDMAPEEVELRFRRKGLAMTYPEDRLTLRLEANPIRLEGDLTFADGNTVCDFGRYVDNELGRLTLPDDRELSVEFDAGEDHWLKVEPAEEGSRVWRVVGGWRPNDPTADGRQQSARLVIRSAATGECEVYTVVRRNWGLPVTWFHGVWWCKYNARGRSRNFEDQILVPQDPAAAAGQSVQNYLMSCSPEEFRALWGWAYQGDSGVGMQVVDLEGVPSMEGFTTGSKTHINKLPADALAPDGYELPSMEEFNRVFDATDYVWVMWSGSHKLRNPWEGHADVRRTQTRRNGIAVGSLELNDLLVLAFSSPDFPGYEALTWYGPGAQWNQAGIVHSNHCNNMLFAVHSPAGSGWYITGGMANLYLTQNGAGNNDTRIVRFKKSPVEYIY